MYCIKMGKVTVFLSIWLLLMVELSSESGVTEEQSIKTFLDSALTKTTPPLDLFNKTVFLEVDLFQILNVDERNGNLLLKLYVYYYYYVPSAYWDPATYGGIEAVQVAEDTYWTPDIIPWEANEIKYRGTKYQAIFTIPDDSSALVSSWSSVLTMQVSCSFTISDFPYDEQHCPLHFGSWQFPKGIYYIDNDEGLPIDAELQDFDDHDEWNLVRPLKIKKEVRIWNGEERDVITLDMYIKRLPLFYTMIWVIPAVILYLLAGLVFLVPVDAGEKISLIITILLAQVVNLGTLATFLPATSRNFPTLGYFMLIVIIQVSIIGILTVFVINVHNAGGKIKMGYRLRSVMSSKRMWILGLRPCPMEKAFPGLEENVKTDEANGSKSGGWMAGGKVSDGKAPVNGSNEIKEEKNLRKALEGVTQLEEDNTAFLWEYCAQFFDRLFLYLHSLISLFVLLFYLVTFVQ